MRAKQNHRDTKHLEYSYGHFMDKIHRFLSLFFSFSNMKIEASTLILEYTIHTVHISLKNGLMNESSVLSLVKCSTAFFSMRQYVYVWWQKEKEKTKEEGSEKHTLVRLSLFVASA